MDDIINKIYSQYCGDILKVLEKTNIKKGTNSLYRCQFQKYPCEIFVPKVRILEGAVNNPQIEIKEFVNKEWLQHCGDSLRIISKVGKENKWNCEFVKYPYKIEARKEAILRGTVLNPRIEEEEFINKIWPQNCGDSIRIIEKDNQSGCWKTQFIEFPYKEFLFFKKDRIKEGSCLNPQLEINLIGKIYPQNCGDDLLIVERIKKGWIGKFQKYPFKIFIKNQKYFLNGNVINPEIERLEFIEKIWLQNCGDSLKIIKKSEKCEVKENNKREFLWECEFIKYPCKVFSLKQNILLGQVINLKLPHLSKEGLKNYIEKIFKEKPTYEEVAKSLNISRTHLNHQIIEFGLKDLICFSSESQQEKQIRDFCLNLDKSTEKEGNWSILENKEIDIYISNKHLGIEFNGNFWHSSDSRCGRDNNYHQEKSLCTKEKGIFLIHIFEFEWELKQDIIKSLIKSKLGIFDKKIGASKCKIKEISIKDYQNFCDKNHLQGKAGAKVKLGLFYKEELVQIISFGVPRFTDKYEWEIIRECSKLGYFIIGGKEKLWSFFVRNYNPESVISYCDFSKFNGNSYFKLGFENNRLNKPGFWWYDNKNNEVLLRTPSKNQEYKDKYLKIYDAGQLVFTWFKKN